MIQMLAKSIKIC